MAKKTNLMKLTLETRGQVEIASRRPAALPPALYLMQLRLPKIRISPSKIKLPVVTDPDSRDDVPQWVKIRHVA
jgi:hypothetical protein